MCSHWWCMAGCGGSEQAAEPPANFAIESTRGRLDNGLEVMVVPDRSVPTVTAMVAFRSGAFVESEAQSGYSHVLEHMIWKGSADVPDPVQFRQRLQWLGALTNATTDDDSRHLLRDPAARAHRRPDWCFP